MRKLSKMCTALATATRGTPTIVALGPLADEYDRLLRDAGLVPPIRTLRLAGEALLEYIGSRRFDGNMRDNERGAARHKHLRGQT